MRGINVADEAQLPEERKKVSVPTLLIVSKRDAVTRAEISKDGTSKGVKDLKIEELESGHWIQLELPDKLNQLLLDFASA